MKLKELLNQLIELDKEYPDAEVVIENEFCTEPYDVEGVELCVWYKNFVDEWDPSDGTIDGWYSRILPLSKQNLVEIQVSFP